MSSLVRTSSSVAASSSVDDQYQSLDRFGSLDSSDTFLSCNTHPFPSQGSLAGLEELAAVGSMAANGSMPTVNIPGFNSATGVYINPFDPPSRKSRRSHHRQQLAQSPKGSPHRRVRIVGRSASSDNELDAQEGETPEEIAPKHKRTRVSQVGSFEQSIFKLQIKKKKIKLFQKAGSKPKPRFELGDAEAGESGHDNEESKRRPSYMPTRGLAAVLNQGLASLGNKLGRKPHF